MSLGGPLALVSVFSVWLALKPMSGLSPWLDSFLPPLSLRGSLGPHLNPDGLAGLPPPADSWSLAESSVYRVFWALAAFVPRLHFPAQIPLGFLGPL